MATNYTDTSVNELIISKISQEQYLQLSSQGMLNENEIYLVENEILDAMGHAVVNVADPTELSDAANKHYVDSVSASISASILSEISSIQDSLSNFLSALMVETTWAELTAMRYNSELIPGMSYRITDYVATVNQDMYSDIARSANHPFDIVVVADSDSQLNEKARAIKHDEDEYFSNAGSNLAAWEIWYDIENNGMKFDWVDEENGKGVIYRMIDEFGNDLPYDFKGIQFKAYQRDDEDPDDVWRYTFDFSNDETNQDGSLYGSNIHSNKIEKYIADHEGTLVQALNRIVFKTNDSTYVKSNTFSHGCNSMTFEDSVVGNVFKNDCSSNKFNEPCYNSSFGAEFTSNVCRDFIENSSFGDYCANNDFGNVSDTSFGSYCNENIIGGISRSSFGVECSSNTIDSGENIHVGNGNTNIKIGSSINVRIGNGCSSITIGDECQNIEVGNDAFDITFHNNCSDISFGDYCNTIRFMTENDDPADNYINIRIGPTVEYLDLICVGKPENAVYQNVTIMSGVRGDDDEHKRIEDSNFNQTFHTTYQPANSIVVSV